MKRDLDLVREILLKTEEADRPLNAKDIYYKDLSQEVILYHVGLMANKGLLDVGVFKDFSAEPMLITINGLTWDGQDLLDTMRNKAVWAKAKNAIKRTIETTTFEVIKQVCIKVSTDMAMSVL